MNETISKLEEIGVNVQRIEECLSGNDELFIKLLKKFLVDEDFDNLKTAFENDDCETIERSAHSLKGVSGNLGLDKMFEYFSSIVAIRRGKENGDEKALFEKALIEKQKIEEIIGE